MNRQGPIELTANGRPSRRRSRLHGSRPQLSGKQSGAAHRARRREAPLYVSRHGYLFSTDRRATIDVRFHSGLPGRQGGLRPHTARTARSAHTACIACTARAAFSKGCVDANGRRHRQGSVRVGTAGDTHPRCTTQRCTRPATSFATALATAVPVSCSSSSVQRLVCGRTSRCLDRPLLGPSTPSTLYP